MSELIKISDVERYIEELEDENARLRQALETIVADISTLQPSAVFMAKVAKAALEVGDED